MASVGAKERRQKILDFIVKLPVRDLDEAIIDQQKHLDRLTKYREEGYKYIQIYGPFYIIAKDK